MSAISIAVAALAGQQSVGVQGGPPYAAVPHSLRHPNLSGLSVSPAPLTEVVKFAVSLQPRDMAGLQNFVEQVSDPKSATYRQFLTPTEIGARFGPAQADVNATVSFLKSSGCTVDNVAKNNFTILAHGTVTQVTAAFRSPLVHVATTDDQGKPWTYRTNTVLLQMPASLVPKIVSIDGIDSSLRHRPFANTTQMDVDLARNCYGARTGYISGFYGQGVNVAIANWDGYNLANVPVWIGFWFMPVPTAGAGTNITVEEVGTGPSDGSGNAIGEGDLDIQSVVMGAPLANITVYDDAQDDSSAPISTYSQISSDNTADVVTESYGWEIYGNGTFYSDFATAAYNLHLSMAGQGITYMAASGDQGAASLVNTTKRYSYPDIDPTVLIVGGSEDTVNEMTGERVSSASWGVASGEGGAGGFDNLDNSAAGFAFNVAPSYQTTYISAQATANNYRLVPDIAGFSGGQDGVGNNNGTGWAFWIMLEEGGTFNGYLFDGTSIASPTTAGYLSALLSHLYLDTTPNASRSNVRLGEIQPLLYSWGSNASVFYDITTGTSVGNLPGGSTPAAPAVGWDYATGWGELNFLGLYQALVAKGY